MNELRGAVVWCVMWQDVLLALTFHRWALYGLCAAHVATNEAPTTAAELNEEAGSGGTVSLTMQRYSSAT